MKYAKNPKKVLSPPPKKIDWNEVMYKNTEGVVVTRPTPIEEVDNTVATDSEEEDLEDQVLDQANYEVEEQGDTVAIQEEGQASNETEGI